MSHFKRLSLPTLGGIVLTALLLPGFASAQSGAPVIQESAPATASDSTAPATTTTTAPAESTESTAATPKPKPKPKVKPAPATTETATPSAPAEPAAPAVPKLVNLAPPAQRFGDGVTYIGHRFYEEKGGGWGWIKKEGDSWGSAKWVALKEDPILGRVAPSRKMGSRSADQDYEYRMTGRYIEGKFAYDPHLDENLPVFAIESYQSLGPAKPIDRKPGPPERFTRARRSRSSSRDDRPIIQHPDSDSF